MKPEAKAAPRKNRGTIAGVSVAWSGARFLNAAIATTPIARFPTPKRRLDPFMPAPGIVK
jgi:hypothetical protein